MFVLSQVEAPIPVQAEDPKNKSDCYGVFCLTYDLKAVSFSSLDELGLWDFFLIAFMMSLTMSVAMAVEFQSAIYLSKWVAEFSFYLTRTGPFYVCQLMVNMECSLFPLFCSNKFPNAVITLN